MHPDVSTLVPASQELFYEWTLELRSNRSIQNVAVVARNVLPDDRVAVRPEYGSLSPATARWLSGFVEPYRTPDYYTQTLSLPSLSGETSPIRVVARRSLVTHPLPSKPLLRIDEITAPDCHVEVHQTTDDDGEVRRLQRLSEKLVQAIRTEGRDGPIPIGVGPGDAAFDEHQVAVEARCETDRCERYLVQHLEARLGTSPSDYARLRRYEQCDKVADAVRETIGCVDGPYCAESETTPCEFSMCSGTMLDGQQAAGLMAVLTKNGVAVETIAAQPGEGR